MFRQIVFGLTLLLSLTTQAAIEEWEFDTESERAQFKRLTADMRCPKCLNSNLAGSDAPIAQDLTEEIYKQIREGRSNDEIIDFMKSRYGDFILYRPPLNTGTFFLWFGPGLLLLAGLLIAWRSARKNDDATNDAALSEAEQAKLAEILAKEKK